MASNNGVLYTNNGNFASLVEDYFRRLGVELEVNDQFAKTASESFDDIITRVNPPDRPFMAYALANIAYEYGYPVPLGYQKWAGVTINPHRAADLLRQREPYLTEEERDFLREKSAELLQLEPMKLASVLYQIDLEKGLDTLWDKQIDDPFSLFTNQETPVFIDKNAGYVTVKNVEIPIPTFDYAIGAGILDGIRSDVETEILMNPKAVEKYAGTDLEDLIFERLLSMGLVQDTLKTRR